MGVSSPDTIYTSVDKSRGILRLAASATTTNCERLFAIGLMRIVGNQVLTIIVKDG